MPLVSVTRLRVRLLRYLPGFFLHTFRTGRQIRRAEGNLSFSLLNDARHTFWTLTVWRDEASMRNFMLSGAHREAMPHLLEWCDEASLVHWLQESEEPPVWAEAHRRLKQQGRLSKVNHPSVAHTRFEIPPPPPRARPLTISRV